MLAVGRQQCGYYANIPARAANAGSFLSMTVLKHSIHAIDAASSERLGIVGPIHDRDVPWVIADF